MDGHLFDKGVILKFLNDHISKKQEEMKLLQTRLISISKHISTLAEEMSNLLALKEEINCGSTEIGCNRDA